MIFRFSFFVTRWVSATNNGNNPMGSTATKIGIKARNISLSMGHASRHFSSFPIRKEMTRLARPTKIIDFGGRGGLFECSYFNRPASGSEKRYKPRKGQGT